VDWGGGLGMYWLDKRRDVERWSGVQGSGPIAAPDPRPRLRFVHVRPA
jgi:hypothetical protein